MQQVHNGGDLLVAVDHGSHDGRDGLAELALQGVQAGLVVAVVLIGAVDEDHAGLLAQHLPGALHTHGQAVLGGAHQHGALGGADGGQSLAGEVEVAGGVHDVDLHALIIHGSKGQGNGNLALDLLGVVVAGGVAVGGAAQAVGTLGHKEHLLGQRSLAGAAVAQQGDVADVVGSHSGCSPFVFCTSAVFPPRIRSTYGLYNILPVLTTIFLGIFSKISGKVPRPGQNQPSSSPGSRCSAFSNSTPYQGALGSRQVA